MSFRPSSFDAARANFKPMKRGTIKRGTKRLTTKKRIAKKSKKKSITTLKNKVWKQFSVFIRTRGVDSSGIAVCVTCDVRRPWREMQAGHFIAGRNNAVLFCERGTNIQCSICNVYKHGNGVFYYKWMLKNYGQEVIDELILESNQTRKWSASELEELLAHYSALNSVNPLVSAESDG